MAFQILLVEGKCAPQNSCAGPLERQGFRVLRAHTLREAHQALRDAVPDLLILDLRRLRFDGLRFCNSLIAQESPFPILLILADGQEAPPNYPSIGILRGVTPRKLLRRVRRLLSGEGDSVVRAGDIFLDLKLRVVRRGGREHRLTPRQTRLLEVFLRHPGRVLSRAFLMREVWETDYLDDARTLEVHVHWLRKAIEDDPHHPVYLKTVRKVGYVLDLPMASSRRR
ncbi:MAG: response regulator [Thermoflexia bacterium]|nr:MAG: response regulator [Thermoflexia bacterium]